jgi:hypothetical protein
MESLTNEAQMLWFCQACIKYSTMA